MKTGKKRTLRDHPTASKLWIYSLIFKERERGNLCGVIQLAHKIYWKIKREKTYPTNPKIPVLL